MAAALSACEPTCQLACRQLLRCDLENTELETSGIALDACEASCVFQEDQYEEADDNVNRARLADHKRCVANSTCEEVAVGACYDEALFPFVTQE